MFNSMDTRLSCLFVTGFNFQHEFGTTSFEGEPFIWLTIIILMLALLGMSIQPNWDRSERSQEEMEQDAKATIKRLLAEFGDKLEASGDKLVAAIYIRYSTSFQDSFEAQLRSALQKAVAMGFSVSAENVFFDLGISGAKKDRQGLEAIREARKDGKFKVFISLATSRLARKLITLLEVLDDEFVGNGIRCILTDQNLDSDDRERWKLLLPLMGWLDEIQRTSNVGHIVASHKMLLARRLKYSSQTYGFGGQPIDGFFTKRGRLVELIMIDDSMAIVVILIFQKFNAGTPVARIVKQLNEDPTLPRPPKSKKNRFSRDFVMKVLQNERYLGIYVYNDEADVSNLSPDEMRELATTHGSVFSFPELQIIPDQDFLSARAKLQNKADRQHLREPKSKRPASNKRPRLLNNFLFCPGYDNQLVATGANGNNYGCKTCKFHPSEQQHLYSQMPRKLATELVVAGICEEVFSNEEVLEQGVKAFVAAAKQLQQPDPAVLKMLEQKRKHVKSQLDLLLSNFSGDNMVLVKDQMSGIRNELSRLNTDIARQQRLTSKAISIPSEEEAREQLQEFRKALAHFAFTSDGAELDQARQIIQLVTGGRIEAYQCGEKAAQKGWCQLRFKVNPAALLCDFASIPEEPECPKSAQLVIDIVEEEIVDPRIEKARALYDGGQFEIEIAKEFSVSRGTVFKWITKSFRDEGSEKPNGYQRRKRIETQRGLHHYQKISDQVFELAESGMQLQKIAELLETNRDVITKAWNYAREKRGLPPLDGRTRRKSLPRKPR